MSGNISLPEYRVCGAYVHMAQIIFHQIDPRRNLYIDMNILKKITVRYIEYIQMNLYQSADTIYDDNNSYVLIRTSEMDMNFIDHSGD